MPVSEPLLVVRDIEYDYTGAAVLHGVSLEVRAGEIVALVGRNGAGKSTLLRCAAGWSAPTRGTVHALGQELRYAERELRRNVVLVTDTPPFYDDLTGREHIRFVLRANHLEDRLPAAEQLLAGFGISSAADAYPSTFSRGMRYKLALVIALAVEPRVLLLDEPFGPIDPVSAGELWTTLRAAASRGCGILLSSHQLPESALPDRYIILEDGNILAPGAPADAGDTNACDVDAILRAALNARTEDADA